MKTTNGKSERYVIDQNGDKVPAGGARIHYWRIQDTATKLRQLLKRFANDKVAMQEAVTRGNTCELKLEEVLKGFEYIVGRCQYDLEFFEFVSPPERKPVPLRKLVPLIQAAIEHEYGEVTEVTLIVKTSRKAPAVRVSLGAIN